MPLQRIDKLIASQTEFSRKEVRRLVKQGRVTVNQTTVLSADQKCDTGQDTLLVNGEPVVFNEFVYIMLNKPKGVLSASSDPKRETAVDLVRGLTAHDGLFPVGRLDKDTTGLLLITDDGAFAHRIISPKKGIEKAYRVLLDGPCTKEDAARFRSGISLADGTFCKPAELTVMEHIEIFEHEPIPEFLEKDADRFCEAEVVIKEGRYHQVKRMFGVLSIGVIALKRVRVGGIRLDKSLPEGGCRILTEEEIAFIIE